jgi:hypothetical protein
MQALQSANLVVRFALELCALAAVAYWGSQTGSDAVPWVLALTAPAAVAIVWGIYLAPKRRVDLPKPVRFAIELGVFAIAAIALWATGQETLAITLAVAELVSGGLNYLWGEASLGLERPPGPPG